MLPDPLETLHPVPVAVQIRGIHGYEFLVGEQWHNPPALRHAGFSGSALELPLLPGFWEGQEPFPASPQPELSPQAPAVSLCLGCPRCSRMQPQPIPGATNKKDDCAFPLGCGSSFCLGLCKNWHFGGGKLGWAVAL